MPDATAKAESYKLMAREQIGQALASLDVGNTSTAMIEARRAAEHLFKACAWEDEANAERLAHALATNQNEQGGRDS